jgi:hypothetical protein
MRTRLVAFPRFWYDFAVGDDWRVAVGVVAALVITGWVGSTSIPAWWILPLAVLVMLPMSLWREASRIRRVVERSDDAHHRRWLLLRGPPRSGRSGRTS